jgi:hypothetical protein
MGPAQELTKEWRMKIYSCPLCELVQKTGVENLEAIDERKYVFHLRMDHFLEP